METTLNVIENLVESCRKVLVPMFFGSRMVEISSYTAANEELLIILRQQAWEQERIRIWYGNKDTGLSWNEENDVIGHLSTSTGEKAILLLIPNKRSNGGGHVLDDCIIRIDCIKTRKTLYQHENFYVDLRRQGLNVVNSKNEIQASFKTEKKAENWLNFQLGKRYAK